MDLVVAGDGQQPPLALAGYGEQSAGPAAHPQRSLDDQFAHILSGLMADELTPAAAIEEFMQASEAATQQYREGASAMLHRAAHRLHMFELAAEQEAQAASWLLLQTLYCSGDTPAGVYQGADDVGGRLTLRQMMANTVNGDATLRRFAQVVVWLEALAAARLSGAPAARFAPNEGLWRATQLGLGHHTGGGGGGRIGPAAAAGAGGGAGGGVELDPDAPTRHAGQLLAGLDQAAEERLAGQLWHLIRAGKLCEARQLCCQAGQAWRSLSLSVGGEWGPLPVGPAAQEAGLVLDAQSAAEELAWEVEGGAAAGMLAWKWACLAAADAAANNGSNKWEAAVYGALCGHVKRMLPVCSSWQDEAWAYCRSWLSLQTDALLVSGGDGVAVDEADEEQHRQLMLGAGDGEAMQVPLDLLEGCVELAAMSGDRATKPPSKQRLQEGLSVMAGKWPLPRLAGEGDTSLVPSDFRQLAGLLLTSSRAAVAAACRQQQHALQLQLMAEDWESLVLQLVSAAKAAAHQLGATQRITTQRGRAQQQQLLVQPAAAGAAAGGVTTARSRRATSAASAASMGGSDVDMDADEDGGGNADDDDDDDDGNAGDDDSGSQAGGALAAPYGARDAAAAFDPAGGGGGPSGGSGSQEAAVDVLRFSAHWALALRALWLLRDPAEFAAQAEREVAALQGAADRAAALEHKAAQEEFLARLQHELNGVIQDYTSHLVQQEHGLGLVPLYLCHLRRVGRQALLGQLLAAAMARWPDDEARQQALYAMLASATSTWFDRQQRQQQQALLTAADAEELQEVVDAPLTNGLFGDLRREELRLLLRHTMAAVSRDAARSPSDRCDHLRWLFYSYTAAAAEAAALQAEEAAAQMAPAAAEQVLLPWQNVWADALAYTLVLAAQMALNPGFGGQGLVQLFSVVVPQQFGAAAAAAAAAQAAAAAADSGNADSAALAPLGQPVVQLQVQRQLLALAFWQAYARVEGEYAAWMADYVCVGAAATAAAGAGPDAEALQAQLVGSGEQLVAAMLELAQTDGLLLHAGPELVALLEQTAAAAVAGAAADPAAAMAALGVGEGVPLAAPEFDGPGGALLLDEGEEEDVEEQQDGRQHFGRLALALTLARGGAADARDPGQPYVQLTHDEAQQLQRQLRAFLQAATSALPDVSASTHIPEPHEPLGGCVVVELASYRAPAGTAATARDAAEAALAASRQNAREVAAWQDMVTLAVQLLSAAPSSGDGDAALPRLALVHLGGSLSTQLAMCRCRTTSKLLRRSAKVLQALVELGHTSPLLDTLLSAAADAGGPEAPQLLEQLSPGDAAKLLARLQATLVEAQGDLVNMQGAAPAQ